MRLLHASLRQVRLHQHLELRFDPHFTLLGGSRATAPMVAAQGAVLIDTSDLTLSAAIAQAIAAIEKDFPNE